MIDLCLTNSTLVIHFLLLLKTVFHLAGSPDSAFFERLSLVYARETLALPNYQNLFLLFSPAGKVQLTEDIDNPGPSLSLGTALDLLQQSIDQKPPVFAVSHLFCPTGLTTVRGVVEHLLKIPLLGPSAATMEAVRSKNTALNLARAAGVKVAPSAFLVGGTGNVPADFPFPAVVKPDRADNSAGLSLAQNKGDLAKALGKAHAVDDHVVVEQFIPGREIRAAVIDASDGLQLLPAIEYHVSETHPMRLPEDKLDFDSKGLPISQVTESPVTNSCPALLTDDESAALQNACRKLHQALGCRHYSLFDFRLAPDDGSPASERLFFLEAGLFWSFSPQSMISKMIAADRKDLSTTVAELWQHWQD